MNYLGIDQHRQYSHITWLNEKGEVVKSGRVANRRRELEGFLQGARDVRAVIEAGRSSYTTADILAEVGIETAVAHPKQVRAIARAKVKTGGTPGSWPIFYGRDIFLKCTSDRGRIVLRKGCYVNGPFT